jgi:sugar phosphate isomerase/epimerase
VYAKGDVAPPAKRVPIGIELYAVRNELRRDLPATLAAVKSYGYEVVEFYAPYLGWTIPYAKTVRTMIDDLGLRCHSTHNGMASLLPGDTMTKAIEINQILGSRMIVLASPPRQAGGAEDARRSACRRVGRPGAAWAGRGIPQSPQRVGADERRAAPHGHHRRGNAD